MTITLDLTPYVRLTDEQFMDLCQRHPEAVLELTSRGELVVMSPTGTETGHRNSLLIYRLMAWSEQDGTGLVFDSSTMFRLPSGAYRSPDASWIARGRYEMLTAQERETFSPICPDFVAELLSPSDRLTEARAKLAEYLENGVRLGWLLDPKRQVAEIYRAGSAVEILERPSTLAGEDVLPGLELRLEGILL